MKFEKIDGQQFIILEDNDEIRITTANNLRKNSITITENEDKISINGDSTLVDSICGEGMLDKVYIPPVVSSSEIISKCDKWLEMFKQVHDKFRELVLSDNYRKQNVTMVLRFPQFINGKSKKRNLITLYLEQMGTLIQEGVSISVDEINDDVFAYLMANVIDYYLSKNCDGIQIDYSNLSWNHTLYSNVETRPVPIIAFLSNLCESYTYSKIVTSLLCNHNVGASTEQIISNLRNNISNQQLSDKMNESIDYSNRQYEHIVTDSNKVKQKKLDKAENPK